MADENPSDFQCDCGGEVEIVKDVLNTPNTLPKTADTLKTHKPRKPLKILNKQNFLKLWIF